MRKKVMLRVLLPAAVASFLSFLPDMARAEEPSPFIRTVSVAYRAISRELLETTVIEDIKIRTQGAINTFSQITVPLNEHFQELDTLEAETVKANGQRIKVEADKILVSGLPNAAQFGVFQADVKNRTIVFPDVEVGDTLHYALKFHGKAPSLPGGFEIFWSVPSGTRYGSVDISLDAPADLAIATRSETFTTEVVAANGRKIHHWRLAPQPYRRAEAGSISARDISPFVTFTSRESIEAVGRTTYADYAPKAEPTAEVRALADEITRGLTDRTAQARAIYDYVAVKIRYFLVYLGRGGSVPHAANEILANKFGDCKDHVTLMRALLSAKGIDADYVLINIGSPTYRDFEIPSASWDHVILYLPEFDLYTDPTDASTAFGHLPHSEPGKLVLRINKAGTVKTRIPLTTAESRRLSIKADVTLRPDGTPKGAVTWTGTGMHASALRGVAGATERTGRAQYAKDLLTKLNWRGTGDIEAPNTSDHAEPFVVKASFDLSNKFFGAGKNTNAVPMGPRLINPPYLGNSNYVQQGHEIDYPCQSSIHEVIADVHLPEGRTLAKVPDAVDIARGGVSYKATYALNGSTLHIERRWEAKMTRSTCSKADALAMEPVAKAAANDAATRLLFAGEPETGGAPKKD